MSPVTLQPAAGAPSSLMQQAGAATRNNDPTGFSEVLKKSVDAVNERMKAADAMAQGLVSGQHANIHETMIALEKANISFRLMTKVQQKAIDAYREIMRIQL